MISAMRRGVIRNRLGLSYGVRRYKSDNINDNIEFNEIIKQIENINGFFNRSIYCGDKYDDKKLIKINKMLINSKENVIILGQRNGFYNKSLYWNCFWERFRKWFGIAICLSIFDFLYENYLGILLEKDYYQRQIRKFYKIEKRRLESEDCHIKSLLIADNNDGQVFEFGNVSFDDDNFYSSMLTNLYIKCKQKLPIEKQNVNTLILIDMGKNNYFFDLINIVNMSLNDSDIDSIIEKLKNN